MIRNLSPSHCRHYIFLHCKCNASNLILEILKDDKIWGQFALASPIPNFWGLVPLSCPPAIYAHAHALSPSRPRMQIPHCAARCLEVRLLRHRTCHLPVVVLPGLPARCCGRRLRRYPAADADVRVFELHLTQSVKSAGAVVAVHATRHQTEESLAEVLGQECIEDWVDAAVRVRQTVGSYFSHRK